MTHTCFVVMGIDQFLERKTGAGTRAWIERGIRFVTEAERRRLMLDKLHALAVRSKVRDINAQLLEGGDISISLDDLDLHCSGIITYTFNEPEHRNRLDNRIGVTIFPENAKFSEVVLPNRETSYGGVLAKQAAESDPGNWTYVLSATLAETSGSIQLGRLRLGPFPEKPLLGISRSGDVVKSLRTGVEKPTNGGFEISNGNFVVHDATRLKERFGSRNSLIEQGLFVVNNQNWDQAVSDPDIQSVNSYYCLGILRGDGKSVGDRTFVLNSYSSYHEFGFRQVGLAMETVAKSCGFTGWEMVCLDFGGAFAGMIEKGAGYDGKDRMLSPEFKHLDGEVDVGHQRNRFYQVTWQK